MKISPMDFMQGMNELAELWPQITSRARLERYKKAVRDMDNHSFSQMINEFLDQAKFMPLPKDFAEWGKVWKRKQSPEPTPEPYQVLCEKCGDLGILRCQGLRTNITDTLMRCSCRAGLRQPWALPMIEPEFTELLWRVTKPPIEWFRPDEAGLESMNLTKALNLKAIEWRGKVAEAETYWRELGYEQKIVIEKT